MGEGLRPFDVNGNAIQSTIFSLYPLIRSRHKNLWLSTDLSYSKLIDRIVDTRYSDRDVSNATIALNYEFYDDLLYSAKNLAAIRLKGGYENLSNLQFYKTIDYQTAKVAGTYGIIQASYSRLQNLRQPWLLKLGIDGQYALKNLDNVNKMLFGGPYNNPGYPIAEALADSGLHVNAELIYNLTNPWWCGNTQIGGKFDFGWFRLHQTPWYGWQIGNPIIKNIQSLTSASLFVNQTYKFAIIQAMLGRQFGANKNVSPVTGNADDHKSSKYRFWLRLILRA